MLRFIQLLILSATLLSAPFLHADPIQDLSMNNYEAGWYPNFYKGKGPLTCPRACETWVGARSESEQSSDIDEQTRRTNVCKVTRDEEIILESIDDPKSHWLYGNQFDDYPVCFVHPAGYEPFKSELFMCECVRPKENTCKQPDLVVVNIADPVWDNTNGGSLVDVTVSNIGGSAAGTFYTRVIDPATNANDIQSVSSLAAGASVTLTFTFNYWLFDPDAELDATADYKGHIEECNEKNNGLSYFKKG
ncbi:CARDB domain-containing protein [Marinimicrobium agarilyticum]|uniref:CARDB domain-containing protein n=1 Tax=Marinimicrobium agarilyticum TaxID=306546 RepID=UPI00047FD6CE|nr:CARDB domain-containing protein [Marinimicrobium agarilyticum]